jgi:hypothetical protein
LRSGSAKTASLAGSKASEVPTENLLVVETRKRREGVQTLDAGFCEYSRKYDAGSDLLGTLKEWGIDARECALQTGNRLIGVKAISQMVQLEPKALCWRDHQGATTCHRWGYATDVGENASGGDLP